MQKKIIFIASLAFISAEVFSQGTLPARKAPVFNCGDMEYDEGTDVVYYKNVPFTGLCKTWFEDNSLEREVNFVNGKEHGASKTYYKKVKDTSTVKAVIKDEGKRKLPGEKTEKITEPDEIKGQLQSITTFNMGVSDGTWEYYYANGKMAWKNTYLAGVKNGRWTWYFENGNPKKVETYSNNMKNGAYILYYEGKDSTFKKSEINYKMGRLDGSYKLYYDNGQVKSEEKYKEDKVDGESLMYYDNGQLAVQQNFKNGSPEGEWREWYDNGQERKFEKFVNGKKEGEHKAYHKEGQVKSIANFKQDRLISFEEYDEFGNKLETEFKAPETKTEDSGKKKKKRAAEEKKEK
jgi:antitoxin component YwqK of YwqJK toxin-antitoxin module